MSRKKQIKQSTVEIETADQDVLVISEEGSEFLSETAVESEVEDIVLDSEDSDELSDFAITASKEEQSFLPELNDSSSTEVGSEFESLDVSEELDGTELQEFESADIEELEFVEENRLYSIIESILFASDRPVSLNQIKIVFKGTNVKTDKIRRTLERMAIDLAGVERGMTLEEVPGGYQLRTKVDNMNFIARTMKARPFRLSGPALEVLSIVAYKQPVIKSEIDEIRGVESGHLLRALMEKGLVNFEGKSDLPGRPMLYATTRKFLEIFGLRNLKELPTLSQIDELLPEGIDEQSAEKPTLSQITDSMSEQVMTTYSEGEEELQKITGQLEEISTSSDFFEQEKIRQKQKKEADRAQSLREAILVGEEVSNRDRNWLARYEEALTSGQAMAAETESNNFESIEPDSIESVQMSEQTDDENHSDDEELDVPYHDNDDESDAGVNLA